MSELPPQPPREPINFASAAKDIRDRREALDRLQDRELQEAMKDVIKAQIGYTFLKLRISLKHRFLELAETLHLRRNPDNQQK